MFVSKPSLQLVDGLIRSKNSVEQYTKEQDALNAEVQNGSIEMDNSSTKAEIQRLQDAQATAQMSLERAIFCISVFLAHEFVHCFTGYLTGSAQPGTPPGLDALPYSDRKHGEAGWYWTKHTFGGLAHVWFDKDEPAEPGHFGLPMLLDYNKRRSNSFFYQIDHAVVKRVLGDDWASANRIGKVPSAQFVLILHRLTFDTDPEWFWRLKDENTKISFKEWETAYEEIVARTGGEHDVRGGELGIRVLFKSIYAALRPCLSLASRLSLRNILPISSTRSRIRHRPRRSLLTENAISKVKRWGQKRVGLHLNKFESEVL